MKIYQNSVKFGAEPQFASNVHANQIYCYGTSHACELNVHHFTTTVGQKTTHPLLSLSTHPRKTSTSRTRMCLCVSDQVDFWGIDYQVGVLFVTYFRAECTCIALSTPGTTSRPLPGRRRRTRYCCALNFLACKFPNRTLRYLAAAHRYRVKAKILNR